MAEGWWQASDGHWYPPEQHPNSQPVPPPPPAFGAPPPSGPQPTAPQEAAGPTPPRWAMLAAVVAILVVVVGGCSLVVGLVVGSNSTGEVSVSDPSLPQPMAEQVPSTGVPEEVPSTSAVEPTSPPTDPAPPTPVLVPMPDVVCMNLQDAQDAIQAAGVFFSRSFDASGEGRSQVLDRNWIVVSQDPAPGVPIGEGDANLGAVKVGEPNPC